MEKSDQDSGSNRNHLARQSEMKHSHSVIDSQEGSPSQPQTPSCSPVKSSSQRSAAEVSTQVVTPPQKPPVHHRFNDQEPLTPRGETKAESNYDGTPSKQRRCSCKASRCLKLYCECFALGSYCNGCNCLTCHNTLEKETSRQEAIKAILERNPDAFKPKIAGSPHGLNVVQEDVRQLVTLGKHNRGCNCKRSGCLKKYCECYQANIRCSENCRCRGCKNFEGSQDLQQTTQLPKLRKRNSASHSVAARGSSASPHLVQNQTVDYVVRNSDTSLFTVPNNRVVSGSTTSTYRSSPSDTSRQLGHVKELCSLLVSKSVDVANRQIQTTQLPELRKRNSASHSVAARASSAAPHLVQNQTVDYVVKKGDTSLFTVPNNKSVSRSTTSTYRSSPSDTTQLGHVKELCSLLVSKSVEVANKMSGTDKERKDEKDSSLDPAQRDVNEINDSPDCVLDANKKIDEKPISPATRALMCDEGLVNISEKEETSTRVRTSQEKEGNDTSSEVYAEQEKQILSCFRDHLFQLFNRGGINGRNIQKANTDPSIKEPEDEEQSHRDPSLGA